MTLLTFVHRLQCRTSCRMQHGSPCGLPSGHASVSSFMALAISVPGKLYLPGRGVVQFSMH